MSLQTINEDDPCATCGQTYGWHLENKPVHPFNTGAAGAKALLGARRARDPQRRDPSSQRGSEAPATVVWPTDPVLRVALITAGVITTDDLRKAEDMLKASMGLERNNDAESPEGARRGQVQV